MARAAAARALLNKLGMTRLAFVLPMLLMSGCHLWFGDDPPPCGDLEAPAYPSPGVRNPDTGRCENQGGGGGNCGDPVPLAGAEAPADAIFLDWAQCDSVCEGLDETTCKATDGCRAAVQDLCPPGADCAPILSFVECWGTAPSGPIRGGGCGGLDAYQCSLHDDCSPVHASADGTYGNFQYCVDEGPTCGADAPVGDTWLRNPASGQCEPYGVPCDGVIPEELPDWAQCWSECEGLDETTCRATDACRVIMIDACPTCDALIIEYAACWPTAPSGPLRGTDCTGLDAYECSRHDDCVAVHEVGPGSFFWCQNEADAPPPPPSCPEITEERVCVETAGCQPIYEGSDCSCDESGCTCATWTFLSCQNAE